MYLDTQKKSECFGCMACLNICPVNAITMKEDEEGFYYPIVDKKKCINCNLCMNVCPYMKKEKTEDKEKLIYGVKLKDTEERKESQSGGAFSAIAKDILQKNGIVYGVASQKNEIMHIRIDAIEQLKLLKGSKYTQSSMNNIYKKIEEDLKKNKLVLFSGTSCQVSGVQNYLKSKKVNTNNFFSCDLICHGVPTPKIYNSYINFWEKKNKSKIIEFNFRDKHYGWHNHIETIYWSSGKKKSCNYYRNLFYTNYFLRPACYKCQFSNTNRISDFSIGDFWGIEKANFSFGDETGVSVIFVNTEKAKKLFENISNDIFYFKTTYNECNQPNLQQPTREPIGRIQAWKDYNNLEFKKFLKKYGQYTIINRIRINSYCYLKKIKNNFKYKKK